MLQLRPSDPSEREQLLDAAAYEQFVEEEEGH